MPFVRLLTVMGDDNPVLLPDAPPLLDVHDAEYERIAKPPLLAGALGAAAGTTAADAADGLLVPSALVAETVQV